MLFLCYHTDDEKLIDIANRYWATDNNGKYLKGSTSFFPLTGASYSSQQTKILSNIATAFEVDNLCQRCKKPQKIQSRSTPIIGKNYSCKECIEIIRNQKDMAESERLIIEHKKIKELIQNITERNKKITADCQSIGDDLAILVLALDRALGNQLFDVVFMQKNCINLAPINSIIHITRLLQAGLLITNPEQSAAGAYFLKDNELWYLNNLVAYQAAPDRIISSGQDIINILQNRPFDQGAVLKSLWIEYAISDCMSYLFSFSSLHGLDTTADENKEIESILRTALSTHSVSNLWSAIWKIVKDAAALSTREYYNKRKAAGTLPGKLKRHLEDVSKGQRSLGSWKRPADQISGSLGEIFYEIWMIDENTPGTELNNIFPISEEPESNELSINRQVVTEMLRRTTEQDLAPEMLTTFANAIAEGKSLMEALQVAYLIVRN